MPIYFKACPRCHGDVAELSDIYGAYLDCLQCGSTPLQLVVNRLNTKSSGISIDAHIETLWMLDGKGKMSAFSSDGLVKDKSLEKRLKAMGQHGYVAVALSNGKAYAPENENYGITSKGREALGAYKVFVKKIREHPESKNAEVSSYELVDEDGNLTLIGEYAIRTSKVLSDFISAIHPMATISLESKETVQEEEPREKQTVNTF